MNSNLDCMFLHSPLDQYCNLFKDYKHCDKTECKVLDVLKENEQLKKDFEQFKKGKVCDLCNYNTVGQDEYIDALEEQLKELEEQNEKMQCCANCKHFNGLRGCRNDYECVWELSE